MAAKELVNNDMILEFTQKEGNFQGWEKTTILGDAALGKLVGVDRLTIMQWREKGLITGKPFGKRTDGRPAYYTYDWEGVKLEIKYNVKAEKVQKKLEDIE